MKSVNSSSLTAENHVSYSGLIVRARSDKEVYRTVTEMNRRMETAAQRSWTDADSGARAAARLLARFGKLVVRLESLGWAAEEIRDRLGPSREVFASPAFMRRCQEWPRGYPGDFETVEYLARGVNLSRGCTIGWYFEEALLKSPIIQQHRNKLNVQAARIAGVVAANARARVLSVACGGCLDWLPVLTLLNGFAGEILLNDCEPAALELAERRLRTSVGRLQLIPGNVLRVVKHLAASSPFELVIAGGLFDYLPDPAVVFLVRTIAHDLLAPCATLLFTNIAEGNPWRPLMEYGANWKLIERSEDKLHELCKVAGVPASALWIEREPTGLTLIARVSGCATCR